MNPATEQLITVAHQGGWDEITAAVAGPLLVIGVLGWIAVKRRPTQADYDDEDFDD
ncbi:hypothetical protein [Streptomyces sp. URMC 129]|uniref:hypothetical protein n=1 Tax=Streptomyces sp. URMC 129 TaxID=3423407 RepID=UPI003F1DC6CA